jgi:hypothetical protein
MNNTKETRPEYYRRIGRSRDPEHTHLIKISWTAATCKQ